VDADHGLADFSRQTRMRCTQTQVRCVCAE
jgi:hypothetical protein